MKHLNKKKGLKFRRKKKRRCKKSLKKKGVILREWKNKKRKASPKCCGGTKIIAKIKTKIATFILACQVFSFSGQEMKKKARGKLCAQEIESKDRRRYTIIGRFVETRF